MGEAQSAHWNVCFLWDWAPALHYRAECMTCPFTAGSLLQIVRVQQQKNCSHFPPAISRQFQLRIARKIICQLASTAETISQDRSWKNTGRLFTQLQGWVVKNALTWPVVPATSSSKPVFQLLTATTKVVGRWPQSKPLNNICLATHV